MIDLLLECAGDPGRDDDLKRRLAAHVAAVEASTGLGDRRQVARIERAIQADPEAAFVFDADGAATLVSRGPRLPGWAKLLQPPRLEDEWHHRRRGTSSTPWLPRPRA